MSCRLRKCVIAVVVASLSASCLHTSRAPRIRVHDAGSGNEELQVPGDPYGHLTLGDKVVFALSQVEADGEDSQLYFLRPDVSVRSWMKWEAKGLRASDYNHQHIQRCHDDSIGFMGGGTATIISVAEPIDMEDFATRNAEGHLITPPYYIERSPGLRRASLANPAYRKYVVDYFSRQIDLGVDGVSFDEVYGYYGKIRLKWPWQRKLPHRRYLDVGPVTVYFDHDEGFDDYFIADFNRYLINKYPSYSTDDWIRTFGMTRDNVVRPDIPYYDLNDNFNYRRYLLEHGFAKDPHNPRNPLAKEWGHPRMNRPDVASESFMEKYLKLYWKEMVVAVRTYAREKYHREIWVSANGIYPYTDFNSLGIMGYDGDYEPTEGLEYLPRKGRHLDGAVSLKKVYLQLREWSRRMSGDVPLVLFIDFPTPLANAYYALPRREKMDFWRIYGAEMYACGIFPAYMLRTPMRGDPTAEESGVLSFLRTDSSFYRDHRDFYLGVAQTDKAPSISARNIEYNVTYQEGRRRYLVHLINHNYDRGILPVTDFTISMEMKEPPSSVLLYRPLGPAAETPTARYEGDRVTVEVPRIDNYAVIALEL